MLACVCICVMISPLPPCRFGGDHIEGERNKVEERSEGLTGPPVVNSLKKEVSRVEISCYSVCKYKE